MKNIILSILLAAASFGAFAQEKPELDKFTFCANLGAMYETVAAWRNSGMAPQTALEASSGFQLPLKLKKESINAVYFDPAFAHAGGMALQSQVRNICLYGPPKPFEPLK